VAGGDPFQIIAAVRHDIEAAADALLSAAELGLRELGAARAGEAGDLQRVEATLWAILEACAFQDLVGQRLSQLEAALGHADGTSLQLDGALLNGPAAPGEGLDQAAIDALMNPGPA
jgi:hypothetical protein